MKYAGAEWLEPQLTKNGIEMSDLGRDVADLLGDLSRGIYHIEQHLDSADWSNTRWIEIRLPGQLATFDGDVLTVLVVLCHDKAIRCEINPRSNSYLTLRFHQRAREGSMFERHPTLEDHVKKIREHYTTDQEDAGG